MIRCDNRPECIAGEWVTWMKQQRTRLEYIQPGKPQQNADIERHNRSVCL